MEQQQQRDTAATQGLATEAHRAYIHRLSSSSAHAAAGGSFEQWATEHLRMSGLYWGLCALDMLDALPPPAPAPAPPQPHQQGEGTPETTDGGDGGGPTREELVRWVLACRHENGGFGGSVGHDPHLLYTLSAVQVLAILDALDQLPDKDRTAAYVASLQRPDGAFMGDEWGEVDTRFVYCALNCLALLGRLPVRSIPSPRPKLTSTDWALSGLGWA